MEFEVPEQSCDCLRLTLKLELGDYHASGYCERCKHDVWIGRDLPEGPATSRGARPRPPGEEDGVPPE